MPDNISMINDNGAFDIAYCGLDFNIWDIDTGDVGFWGSVRCHSDVIRLLSTTREIFLNVLLLRLSIENMPKLNG